MTTLYVGVVLLVPSGLSFSGKEANLLLFLKAIGISANKLFPKEDLSILYSAREELKHLKELE